MSNNSINFGSLNDNEKWSNFIQVAPSNTSDSSQYTYHAQKWDVDIEYLGMVRMALHSCMGSINFANPANIRKVHKELMNQVRTNAIHINNKYKMQVEPIQFKWTSSFQL